MSTFNAFWLTKDDDGNQHLTGQAPTQPANPLVHSYRRKLTIPLN